MLRGSSSLDSLLGSRDDEVHLSNHLREVFRQLDADASERGEEYSGDLLYSRVHSEGFVDRKDSSARMTDSSSEVTTPITHRTGLWHGLAQRKR